MRKSTYAAATLALALAPLAGTTVTAYAGSGYGACHETKADPNPDRGNDQCHDDSQIPPQGGEATGTPTDVATPPTDVTVKDPLPSTTGTDGSTTYPVEAEVTPPGAGGTGTGEPIGPADAKSSFSFAANDQTFSPPIRARVRSPIAVSSSSSAV